MKKSIASLALVIAGVTAILGFKGNIAKADGGIFVPKDYYSAETTQKAFIYYVNQTENMVVLASFKGNAKDFAWVIPTPNKPEIVQVQVQGTLHF